MITYKKHSGEHQPKETHGKWVAYKTEGGISHVPHTADDITWSKKPTIGRVIEYAVVRNPNLRAQGSSKKSARNS